jgi:hypothetical protein
MTNERTAFDDLVEGYFEAQHRPVLGHPGRINLYRLTNEGNGALMRDQVATIYGTDAFGAFTGFPTVEAFNEAMGWRRKAADDFRNGKGKETA